MLSPALRRVAAGPFQVLLAAALVVPLLAFSSLPGSGSSGAAVAAGTVTGPGGAAMPGVAVDLYAWPSDAVLKAMKPGRLVPVRLLAATTTNSVGKYMLRVPAAKLKAAATEAGYANLEIFSPFGGMWFFSYQTGSLPARPAAAVTVNLGGRSKPPCDIMSGGQPYHFSGFMLLRQMKPAWAVVGQGYILRQRKTAGDWVNFEYNQGTAHTQASELGLGVSAYGFEAGYKNAGSHVSTANRTEGFAKARGNAWFRTLFSTGLFRGVCFGRTGIPVPRVRQHGQCPRKYLEAYVHKCLWLVKSTGWFGGTSTVQPRRIPRTSARYCAPHEANSHYDGDLGTAVQWSGGFDLGVALNIKGVNLKAGFNGSAQTGYDVNARMYFNFGHKGYLCGTNRSEASAAILVQRGNLP
ncbi:MAG TPA: hypothetical protein VNF47_03440 [Streptosporangiaceae bacterium]|nr:hypothetical protein [Streptosporangiaceae bacterium]